MKAILLFIFFIISVNAKVLTYEVSTNYIMGDNDTKLEARKIALEQAKKIALEQAGTYMEVKTIVKDGKLTTDEIKSFGASVLTTTIKNEKYSFNGNSPVLELTISSNIDMDVLKNNIEQAKKNKNEITKRIALQKENEKLLKQIEEMKNDYKQRDERNKLISKVEKNNNILVKKFKKGSLLDLSNKYNNRTDMAIEELNKKFFDFIKNNTQVQIENIDVSTNNKETSNVDITYSWKISNYETLYNYVETLFGKYIIDDLHSSLVSSGLDPYSERDFKEIFKHYYYKYNYSGYDITIDKNKIKNRTVNLNAIFNQLLLKQVLVKFSIKNYYTFDAIATGYKHLMGDFYYTNKYKVLVDSGTRIMSFKKIPNNVLSNIDSVKAEVIITHPVYRINQYIYESKILFNELSDNEKTLYKQIVVGLKE